MNTGKSKKLIIAVLMVLIVTAGVLGPLGFNGVNKTAAAVWCQSTDHTDTTSRKPALADGTCPVGWEPCTTAQCQQIDKEAIENKDKPKGGVGAIFEIFGLDLENLALQAAIFITKWVAFKPASWFMYFGGMILDYGVDLNITGSTFREIANDSNSAVGAGWRLSRDIVNIFLIFILLFIAIATILQTSRYGAKELLVTLVIVAFMVNFSMVITKIVIDASNVLAVGFYSFFGQTAVPGGGTKVSISDAFVAGLDAQKIITQSENEEGFKKISDNNKDLNLKILLVYLFGSVIMAIAGFIFLVFGVLFFIRMVVLLLLIVFSPLAFAAHVLPSTKQHASRWWTSLFQQAFFAPAALFMIWFSARLVGPDSFIRRALSGAQANIGSLTDAIPQSVNGAAPQWGGSNVAFIINFAIVIVALCASLVVAKQMSAFGAASVQAGITKGLRKAQGYAGKYTRRGAGFVAEKTLQNAEAGGKFGRVMTVMPGSSRVLGKASSWRERQIKEKEKKYEKVYGSYSTAALKSLKESPTVLSSIKRGVIEKTLGKREKEIEAQKKRKEDDAKLKDPNTPANEALRILVERLSGAAGELKEAAGEVKTSAKESKKEPKKEEA